MDATFGQLEEVLFRQLEKKPDEAGVSIKSSHSVDFLAARLEVYWRETESLSAHFSHFLHQAVCLC